MPSIYDLFVEESTETALARMLSDLPDPPDGGVWDNRTGSVISTLLTPMAEERVRMLSFTREAVNNCFLAWASDVALDAKAGELGVQRLAATPAQVSVTFIGDEGTTIPAGTQVAAPSDDLNGIVGATFQTMVSSVISGGYALIPCEAIEEGSVANVASGQIIELVSSIVGITSVNNEYAALGGTDEEDDASLRERAFITAQAPPSGGNVGYYINIALDDPNVSTARITDRWNTVGPAQVAKSGAGSGLLILSGNANPWVAPFIVDNLQSTVDPSVRCLAHFELAETWAITSGTTVSAEQIYSSTLEGESSWRIHPLAGATTAISWTLSVPQDFSDYTSSADEIWLEVNSNTSFEKPNSLKVTFTGYDGSVCEYTVAAGAIPTGRGRIVFTVSNLAVVSGTATVAKILSQISGVKLTVAAQATYDCAVVVDGLRFVRTSGGLGEGLAMMGMQITVKSANAQMIDVAASVTLATGATIDAARTLIEDGVRLAIADAAPGTTLRLSQVQNAIYMSGPVVDYTSVTMARTGSTQAASNITLANGEQVILGALTLTVV